MTYTLKPRVAPRCAAVSVPALHSLRTSQVALATVVLPALGTGWSLDAETDYHGELCLMLSPPDAQSEPATAGDTTTGDTTTGDTATGDTTAGDITYVLSSDRDDLIMLACVVHETWEDLGRFEQIGDAVRAIAAIRRSGRS